MPRKVDGAWVEYGPMEEQIVRVFSSEIAALRSAVSNMTGVVRIQYGETLAEALLRAQAEGTPEPETLVAPVKRSRKATRPAVDVPVEDAKGSESE